MRYPLFLSAFVLMAGLLACERKDTIRLGGVAPVTGEAATLGTSTQKGYELAVAEWNARGGVLGKRITLVFADDKGDPAEGATVFSKLIEKDRVAAIAGAWMSKVSLAGAPIAQAARVPMIAPGSTNPRVTQTGDYIFRACYIDSLQGLVGARFAQGELHARRAACLFDLGNDYTKGLAEFFRDTFQELGGQMAGFEGHPTGASDFKAQLTEVLQGRPDVIYISDYYNDAALIGRQARELGFRGALMGGDGWDSPRLTEIAGPTLEPAYFTHHFSRDDAQPACQAFVKSYRARYQGDPDGSAALGYDAASMLLEAIRRAGSLKGEAIRDALASSEFATTSGPVRFDAQRNPVKPVILSEIKGGRQVYRASLRP